MQENHSAGLSPSTVHPGPAVGCAKCDRLEQVGALRRAQMKAEPDMSAASTYLGRLLG